MPKSMTLQRDTENVRVLEEHAEAIRELRRKTIDNVIKIGKRLILAKDFAGPGNWLAWLKDEFGWSDQTARNFINVARRSTNFLNMKLPVSSLYLLAAPSTPPTVRKAVVKKARTTKVTHREVVEIVRAAKSSLEKPRSVAVQSARAEPPPRQIQHTEPTDAPFNWPLFVARAEASSNFFERHQDEWREAIRRKSQMPSELRDRLLDCLASLVDQADTMIATFEVPTTHKDTACRSITAGTRAGPRNGGVVSHAVARAVAQPSPFRRHEKAALSAL